MVNEQTKTQSIVLIPAYQPGKALIESTDLLAADFVVIVVNDGSGNEFNHIFDRLDTKIHLVTHAANKGKGAALKTGYRYIKNNFQHYAVITADADGQHHVADIKKMSEAYKQYRHALLLGARTFENDAVPLRSRFGNVLTRKIFSLITKQQLRDTQTGLRAFDDSLINFMIDVPGERFEYEMNVLLACSRENIRLVELPIQTIYENNNESSHFNPIKDSWSIYKQVLKFASSSLISFGIDYIMFIVLLGLTNSWTLASSVTFANVVARITSASFNFAVNRHLIFKHKGSVLRGAMYYALLAGCILLGNTILLNILTSSLHIAPYIAKIITEVAFFCLSYYVQKNLIFANKNGAQTLRK